MSEIGGHVTKDDLNEMESRINDRFEQRLDDVFTRFSQHILHEVGLRFDGVNTRLESIDARLKLHAGLIQAGARAMARVSKFSENSEEGWVELAAQVETLERKLNGQASK